MKKITSFVLFIVLLLGCSVSFAYKPMEKDITVTYSGETVDFEDVLPQNIDGHVMVPLRKIFEMAGCVVDFNGETKTITANKSDYNMKLVIGEKTAELTKENKTENKALEIAPQIIDGRTLVPVRFISESLGFVVNWNPSYKEVVLIDFDKWEESLKDSIFAKVLFEKPVSSKFFNTEASCYFLSDEIAKQISLDNTINLKYEKYALRAGIDTDYNLYIKSRAIDELVREITGKKPKTSVGDKYLKINIPKFLTMNFGVKMLKKDTVWNSLEQTLKDDEFVYSHTVRDIDKIISILASVKVSKGAKATHDIFINIPKEANTVDIYNYFS